MEFKLWIKSDFQFRNVFEFDSLRFISLIGNIDHRRHSASLNSDDESISSSESVRHIV